MSKAGLKAAGSLAGNGLLLLLAVLVAASPDARGDEAQDLKASIVVSCIYQVGEFGSGLVDICVKENLAAAEALAGYPKSASQVVDDCTDRLQGDGWARIKMCVDQALQGNKSGKE